MLALIFYANFLTAKSQYLFSLEEDKKTLALLINYNNTLWHINGANDVFRQNNSS